MPLNPCTNSSGLHELNVKLNPFVKPFVLTNQNNNEIFRPAKVIDTAAFSRIVCACLQRDDNKFSCSNKSTLGNVETQCGYDVSGPYQQNNDKFASQQRLDKHCNLFPDCNQRTLYEKEPVLKIMIVNLLNLFTNMLRIKTLPLVITHVVPRYISNENEI